MIDAPAEPGPFARTAALIGDANLLRLKNSSVTVCGIGGVGSFAAEAFARAGVGRITLVDHDTVAESNINRQIHANYDTVGTPKVAAMRERIARINPDCITVTTQKFINEENIFEIINADASCDYIVDAVDTVTAKIAIVTRATDLKIPVVSSMGAANRLRPEMFAITDIYKTGACPLAKVMRKELKKRGVPSLTCCCSAETPVKLKNNILGSVSFVPPAAGLIIAGHVIRELINGGRICN